MIQYIFRRLLYTFPLLLGVNVLTFFLFFVVNTPDDMARMQLGQKHVTEYAVKKWKVEHGYDLPLFVNPEGRYLDKITETIFYQKSIKLFVFQFGVSDSGRDIAADIKQRMWPSLAVALPSLLLGLLVNIVAALLMVLFRSSYVEFWGVVACVVIMSISALFYIIGGQFLFSKLLKLVPISGFSSSMDGLKFLILPVLISVISGLGSGARWYRALFIEEVEKDYVKTARAKGLSETQTLFRHVLGNAMIPILTGVVVVLPLLFMGSLIMESFFSIPGLGSYTIDAINRQDFAIVRSMVFLGSVLYVIGLLLTDLCYTLVDPRVKLS